MSIYSTALPVLVLCNGYLYGYDGYLCDDDDDDDFIITGKYKQKARVKKGCSVILRVQKPCVHCTKMTTLVETYFRFKTTASRQSTPY
jgi:hypothetical protein